MNERVRDIYTGSFVLPFVAIFTTPIMKRKRYQIFWRF
nr:MAG TPA: hypothetical protein [Caudoviricetes sp.]